MRIVSLVPSATEIVYALGLGEDLVGRSHACDYPEEVIDLPIVTLDDPDTPERHLDGALLAALEPDLVLTDGSEDGPLVDYAEISAVVGGSRREVTLVALAPETIEGILNSIATVGAYTEAEYEAVGLVEVLRERLAEVERSSPGHDRRRVVVLEGLDPLLGAGRWVPEMVRRAGGWELLGHEREPAALTSWSQLREVEPEVLILALRDADAAGAARALGTAVLPSWFDELEAVREGEFFAVDGHGLFSRPGPRVIEGVAVLAELLEPGDLRRRRSGRGVAAVGADGRGRQAPRGRLVRLTRAMAPRRAFDCLWCGKPWEVRSDDDLEGWALLCPECLGKADDNGFLRMRLRTGLRERATAAEAGGGSPAAVAVTGDWEDWYLRRGRFSRGPIHDGPWSMELEQVTRWLDEGVSGGVIVQLGAGMGWWAGLLAEKGESWLYEDDAASLEAARKRLVAHGLLAHLHQRSPLAAADKSVEVVFGAYLLGSIEGAAALRTRLAVARSWLKPGGTFIFIEAKAGPTGSSIDGPAGPLWPRDPESLRDAILASGFRSVEIGETRSAFVYGRATAPT